jgi:acetyl esterase/lipase
MSNSKWLMAMSLLLALAWDLSAARTAPAAETDLVTRWLQQMDRDRDGVIARTEATGQMQRFFGRNDANSDEVLDRQELAALAQRLAGGRSAAPPRPRSGASDAQSLPNLPDDVVAEWDVAYRPGASKAWRLDLFRPRAETATPRPGIVFIHGGGWRSGDKRAGTFLNGAIEYARKGYVTITVNYRLTGEASFPACIEDVKCAVRWLRAHAGQYQLDPGRIGGYGNSAGAHLVAMLGLVKADAGLEGDGPWQDQSSRLQAVAASATPTDFNLFRQARSRDTRFVDDRFDPDELRKRCSPINHVAKDAPPFLLFQGTADRTVNVKHGDTFAAALKAAGCDVTYLRIEGAGHGVFNEHADRTKPALEKFFARTLGGR